MDPFPLKALVFFASLAGLGYLIIRKTDPTTLPPGDGVEGRVDAVEGQLP